MLLWRFMIWFDRLTLCYASMAFHDLVSSADYLLCFYGVSWFGFIGWLFVTFLWRFIIWFDRLTHCSASIVCFSLVASWFISIGWLIAPLLLLFFIRRLMSWFHRLTHCSVSIVFFSLADSLISVYRLFFRRVHWICKIGVGLYLYSKCRYVRSFYPLEVVNRGSETQLQVSKKYVI